MARNIRRSFPGKRPVDFYIVFIIKPEKRKHKTRKREFAGIFKKDAAYTLDRTENLGDCQMCWYGKRWKKGCLVFLAAAALLAAGCSIETTNGAKVADLDYEIVEEAQIPEKVKAVIEEKKAADFKTTYELDGDLYIVRGYGEQETGGYSICIRDLYLTSNAILFDTELVGPRKGEQVSSGPSYPYIVIKTEKRDESTIFE